MPPDSLIDKPLGIPPIQPSETCSNCPLGAAEREVERVIDCAREYGRWGHRDATMILVAYRHEADCRIDGIECKPRNR